MRKTLIALITVLVAFPTLAEALPFMPTFQQPSAEAAPPMPNVYQLSPVPPLIPVLMQNRRALGVTAIEMARIRAGLRGNRAMMLAVMQQNRVLHEDILNGITGAPVTAAENAVAAGQTRMLARSVSVDSLVRATLTAAQWNGLVADYREMETQGETSGL